MRAAPLLAVSVALSFPLVSEAQALRDFCPDRPGLGTPACTLDRGHAAIEIGLADWTRTRQPGSRTDTLIASDILLRYGLAEELEAQVGWTAFGQVRTRSGDLKDARQGTGDMTLALRRNLSRPDGSGFSAAVMPFATLPSGGSQIGAGDWGAGIRLPLSAELSGGLELSFTGNLEAAVDADRKGRHLAYGGVIGLDAPLGETISLALEVSAMRDEDPSDPGDRWLGGLSVAWSPRPTLQFDAGANLGLNRDAPDLQLYFGLARRF